MSVNFILKVPLETKKHIICTCKLCLMRETTAIKGCEQALMGYSIGVKLKKKSINCEKPPPSGHRLYPHSQGSQKLCDQSIFMTLDYLNNHLKNVFFNQRILFKPCLALYFRKSKMLVWSSGCFFLS